MALHAKEVDVSNLLLRTPCLYEPFSDLFEMLLEPPPKHGGFIYILSYK